MRTNIIPFNAPPKKSLRRAFSAVELLVAISIILILVSLGTVAASRMRAVAEVTSTKQLINSISIGLEQFKRDFGYYPPLLNDDLEIETDARSIDYHSTLSLAAYLVGVGNLNRNDELDSKDDFDDGVAGVGFRDPGPDRAWGGATDAEAREDYWEVREDNQGGRLRGEVYGPYLELSDEYLLEKAKDRDGDEIDPPVFAINDYWGQPIRYYRHWPTTKKELEGDLGEWFGAVSMDEREAFFVQLRSADYLLFSPGRDATDESDADDKSNKDNIVEIGS